MPPKINVTFVVQRDHFRLVAVTLVAEGVSHALGGRAVLDGNRLQPPFIVTPSDLVTAAFRALGFLGPLYTSRTSPAELEEKIWEVADGDSTRKKAV